MKHYTHCTLQDNKVLGWYKTLDREGDLQNDFDVLEGWTVYLNDHGSFIAEYTPVNNCIGAYKKENEALQAICDRCNADHKRRELIEKNSAKFVGVSLEEAYKDVNPVGIKAKKETPKSKYLDRLRERTKEMHASVEEIRMQRNWKLANAEYVYALINH